MRQLTVAVDDPALCGEAARSHRPQEMHCHVVGGLKLVGLQRREQGRADGVVEHGGHERAQHVAHRLVHSGLA